MGALSISTPQPPGGPPPPAALALQVAKPRRVCALLRWLTWTLASTQGFHHLEGLPRIQL